VNASFICCTSRVLSAAKPRVFQSSVLSLLLLWFVQNWLVLAVYQVSLNSIRMLFVAKYTLHLVVAFLFLTFQGRGPPLPQLPRAFICLNLALVVVWFRLSSKHSTGLCCQNLSLAVVVEMTGNVRFVAIHCCLYYIKLEVLLGYHKPLPRRRFYLTVLNVCKFRLVVKAYTTAHWRTMVKYCYSIESALQGWKTADRGHQIFRPNELVLIFWPQNFSKICLLLHTESSQEREKTRGAPIIGLSASLPIIVIGHLTIGSGR